MFSYLAAMVFASGLGFFKVISLSQIVDSSAFGHYISLYAVAIFSSILLSFGSVETTLKLFPRLWNENVGLIKIEKKVQTVFKVLSLRYGALLLLACIFMILYDFSYSILDLLCVIIIGWGVAVQMLYASVVRASSSYKKQKVFYLVRSLLSFIFTIAFGLIDSWKGALLGEAVAGIVFSIFAQKLNYSMGIRLFNGAGWKLTEVDIDIEKGGRGGLTLYFSFLLSGVTSYLDKILINQSSGAENAGTYGVVSIIYQVSGLLVNIVTQRIGTKLIKMNVNNASIKLQLVEIITWVGSFILLLCVTVGSLFWIKHLGVADAFIANYNISDMMILYAGFIASLQIYTMLDFFLIAHDGESSVLVSSMLGFIVFAGLFYWGYINKVSIEKYLLFIFLSKLVQVMSQCFFIVKVILIRKKSRHARD